MKTVQIICDRCDREIKGTISLCAKTGVIITNGYYIVSEGNWKDFRRDDEEYICEECMHSDPKYKSLYNS